MIFFLLLFLLTPTCLAAQEVKPDSSAVDVAAAKEPLRQPRALLSAGIGVFVEEQSFEKQFQVRSPWSLRAGWILKRGDAFFEYSRFNVTTGEGVVTIHRTQRIHLLWYRHRLKKQSDMIPYVAGALGAEANSVKTDFGSQSIKSNGQNEIALGAAAGAFTTLSNLFETGIEFRMLASKTFRPNLAIGATLFFGIQF